MITALAFCFLIFYNVSAAQGQLLQQNSVHRTPAAERPANDLWCYRCHTMEPGDRCSDLRGNHTALSHKCKDDKERLCMVKRFAYTTSNENSTSTLKMWSLERNCTKHCEPGCIVIGERTKLYACTSCCDSNLCNNGTGRAAALLRPPAGAASVLAAVLLYLGSRNLLALCASSRTEDSLGTTTADCERSRPPPPNDSDRVRCHQW